MTAPGPLAAVARAFRALGAELSVREDRRRIVLDLRGTAAHPRLRGSLWARARELAYFTLNKYENGWRVVVRGAPWCLFPDAQDHVDYAASPRARPRRAAACGACKYAARCPGMPERLGAALGEHAPVRDLPREVVIEVGKRCNLRCGICFAGAAREAPSRRTIETIMNRAAGLGIKAVRFTGGEPLVRRDIHELLDFAKARGFYVILNTNGTLLGPEAVARLAPRIDNALISLQGCDAAVDRELTGSRFSFEAKLDGIRRLARAVPVVRIGTIITDVLLERFDEYADLVAGLDATLWELYRPMLDRRALAANPRARVTAAGVRALARRLPAVRRRGLDIRIANALPFCLIDDARARGSALSGALADEGHSRLVYDSRGFFKPSYHINVDLGGELLAAWNHPFVRRLNDAALLPAACRRCADRNWCLGGSRFAAAQARGNYFGRDPWMPRR